MKVVIYSRVSTDEQGNSGLGLQAQMDACQRLCDREGYEVLGCFEDVVSGKSDPMTRAGFLNAVTQCISSGSALMVAKLDRFSRDVYQVSRFVNRYMLGAKTPRLIIAETPHAGEFEINLRASLAQEERRMISERTKAALTVRKAQGMNLGEKGRQAHTAKANAATGDAIAIASEMRNQGISLQRICDHLNSQGLLTSRGTAWSKQGLAKRLK